MAGGYLTGAALLTACAAGRGVIVLLEGNDDDHDPYFYGRWFGGRALDISFFPQNGWPRVVDGVRELRAALPLREVFGIIDRDFADDAVLAAQNSALPPDGVFRTRHYTLENYLLAPEGWLAVITVLHRSPPPGWQSPAEVAPHIEAAYRQCIPLAAWNYVVYQEDARAPSVGRTPSLGYKQHPRAMPASPESELLNWGMSRATPKPLDHEYRKHIAFLEAAAPAEWPRWITGKSVLKAFLPNIPQAKQISASVLLNLYLDKHPAPPPELALLVERLIDRHGNL